MVCDGLHSVSAGRGGALEKSAGEKMQRDQYFGDKMILRRSGHSAQGHPASAASLGAGYVGREPMQSRELRFPPHSSLLFRRVGGLETVGTAEPQIPRLRLLLRSLRSE